MYRCLVCQLLTVLNVTLHVCLYVSDSNCEAEPRHLLCGVRIDKLTKVLICCLICSSLTVTSPRCDTLMITELEAIIY